MDRFVRIHFIMSFLQMQESIEFKWIIDSCIRRNDNLIYFLRLISIYYLTLSKINIANTRYLLQNSNIPI